MSDRIKSAMIRGKQLTTLLKIYDRKATCYVQRVCHQSTHVPVDGTAPQPGMDPRMMRFM